MQTKRLNLNWILCAAAVTSFACADRPTIDQVKEHFENPTGATADKGSVIAATGKQDASSAAQRVAGNGAGFGFGLTAVGKQNGLERLQARTMFDKEIRQLKAIVAGKRELALSTEIGETDPCVDEAAVNDAFGELIFSAALGGSASADFSYEIDLDKCTNGKVTGTMSVEGEIELSEESFKFTIEEQLSNVCETTGEKACVDGEFAIEMAAEGDEMMNSGSLSFVTAWFVDASWEEDGARLEAEAKGGIRLVADETSAQLEVLVFVVNADGSEESLVLRVTTNADGSGTIEIRGRDGSISCTINANGSGECVEIVNGAAVMGETKISWTDIEAKEIESSESFGEY
jgi:hypothetical protein